MVAVGLAAGVSIGPAGCGDGESPVPDTSGGDEAAQVDDADGDVEAAPAEDVGDVDGECHPAAYYGPGPVCTDDEDCTTALGPGWYCDPTVLTYPDGCGGTIVWGRVCERVGTDGDADADLDGDADGDAPMGWYGPPPASES
jgi:hypothetical protein